MGKTLFGQFEKIVGKLPLKCRIVIIVPATTGEMPDSSKDVMHGGG